jgi:hypothetical protein
MVHLEHAATLKGFPITLPCRNEQDEMVKTPLKKAALTTRDTTHHQDVDTTIV